jgi:hypothetical protein
MNPIIRLFPALALVACVGQSDEDSGSDSVDTSDTATVSIPFQMGYFDGITTSAIDGAEVCTVYPEVEEPCLSTDGDGLLEWTWEATEFGNVLHRLTHDDYMTTLYAGRYEQDVHDNWMETLQTSDVVEINYWSFKPANIEAYMATGGMVAEEGQGLVVFWLLSGDGSSMDGAVITLENDAGESVGQVVYQTALTNALSPALTATSASGIVAIGNVEPGDHTLTVSHETLTCQPGYAHSSDVANVTTVPVEADSQTQGNMICSAE